MALIAAHLNAGIILVVTVYNDRDIISLSPHLHTPFSPYSKSRLSFMVSVDVQHHVYFDVADPPIHNVARWFSAMR